MIRQLTEIVQETRRLRDRCKSCLVRIHHCPPPATQWITTDSALQPFVTLLFTRLPCIQTWKYLRRQKIFGPRLPKSARIGSGCNTFTHPRQLSAPPQASLVGGSIGFLTESNLSPYQHCGHEVMPGDIILQQV